MIACALHIIFIVQLDMPLNAFCHGQPGLAEVAAEPCSAISRTACPAAPWTCGRRARVMVVSFSFIRCCRMCCRVKRCSPKVKIYASARRARTRRPPRGCLRPSACGRRTRRTRPRARRATPTTWRRVWVLRSGWSAGRAGALRPGILAKQPGLRGADWHGLREWERRERIRMPPPHKSRRRGDTHARQRHRPSASSVRHLAKRSVLPSCASTALAVASAVVVSGSSA